MNLRGYDAYLSSKLSDYELSDEQLQKFTKDLDNLSKAQMRKSSKW